MKLTIVRHGISEQNSSKRIVDGDIDLKLSPAGIKGVQAIAPYLDESQFDLVYSSTLQRAYKTAKILTKGRKKIIKDSRLVELRMGEWLSPEKEQEAYKKAFDRFKNVQANYVDYARNAESFEQIKSRVKSFMDDLLKNHSKQTILVASHGIAIRALMAVIFHNDMDKTMNMNNVAFTEIYFDKQNNPKLMSFNAKYPEFWGLKDQKQSFFI